MRKLSRVHMRRQINMSPLLDVQAVSDHLGVDPRTLRNYVDSGALVAVRLPGSGHLRFRPEVIARFVTAAETSTSGQ